MAHMKRFAAIPMSKVSGIIFRITHTAILSDYIAVTKFWKTDKNGKTLIEIEFLPNLPSLF